jgi:hypothetical protein
MRRRVLLLEDAVKMKALKKSDLKLSIRDEAKRKVRPSCNPGADRSYRESIERGRNMLNQIGNEGGDSTAKKIKGELLYLLNNYLPSYDMRIENLIDQWRRTGDPTYDPGIRTKLRQVRKQYMDKSNPI